MYSSPNTIICQKKYMSVSRLIRPILTFTKHLTVHFLFPRWSIFCFFSWFFKETLTYKPSRNCSKDSYCLFDLLSWRLLWPILIYFSSSFSPLWSFGQSRVNILDKISNLFPVPFSNFFLVLRSETEKINKKSLIFTLFLWFC